MLQKPEACGSGTIQEKGKYQPLYSPTAHARIQVSHTPALDWPICYMTVPAKLSMKYLYMYPGSMTKHRTTKHNRKAKI